jgi:hypothetical protein
LPNSESAFFLCFFITLPGKAKSVIFSLLSPFSRRLEGVL